MTAIINPTPLARSALADQYEARGLPIAAEAIRTGVWDEAEQVAPALAALTTPLAVLEKISAIRDSIIGLQGINWSEHIYPLVAALDEAGFDGAGYEISRRNVGTLLEQIKKAEAALLELLECVQYDGGFPAYSASLGERFDAAVVAANAALGLKDSE